MNVYTVHVRYYFSPGIIGGVFSTRELADAFATIIRTYSSYDTVEVEEFELDVPAAGTQ